MDELIDFKFTNESKSMTSEEFEIWIDKVYTGRELTEKELRQREIFAKAGIALIF